MKPLRKLIIVLIGIAWLFPASSQAGFISKDRTTTYQLTFDLNWYQKFFNLFLRYEFLSWKEINLQELFVRDNTKPNTENNAELVLVSITPKNFNEAMFLKIVGKEPEGFIRFINAKQTKLSEDGIKDLLTMTNYMYDAEEGELEFNSLNFLAEDPTKTLMNWKITKEKSEDKYILKIQIMGFKSKDPSKKSDLANVVAILNPLEKVFERANIEIKNGPKFVLTKKPS